MIDVVVQCVAGGDERRTLAVGERIVVGREASCDVVVSDDGVSRRHAAFTARVGGIVEVEDLGSSNGVWRNATRITTAQLQPGDEVTLGSCRVTIGTYPTSKPFGGVTRSAGSRVASVPLVGGAMYSPSILQVA